MTSMQNTNTGNNTLPSLQAPFMPATPATVVIYSAQSETTTHQTTGIEVMTARSVLSATERMAAYIYQDVRELATKAHLSLAEAIGFAPSSLQPITYINDPNLFQRLLCLDIEHLLRDQHVTDVALFLADATPNAAGQLPLRYRASYHLERPVDWTQGIEDPDTISLRNRVSRQGGSFDPTRHLGPDTRFALAVKWNPQTATIRETALRYPRYHFHWQPAGSIAFDDSALQSAGNTPSAVPAYTDGIWTLNTLTHTTPQAYRSRPARIQ